MRVVALGAALAGGVCLVAHLFLDVDVLSWLGLGLLGVAAAAVGAGLVRARWLAVVTATGAIALAWAVLELAHDLAPDRAVEAAVGGLASLCVAVAMLRRPDPAGQAGRPGNHRS
ncbi:hypothetical protein [Nocardioides sp.]|uniref:hypothetical protein n=1 Tax=Nocardioides sp. TaxID=35761 RepID=UPI002724FAB2|nr:hypothetical protein [Nocardioides sp.]MDO9455327.1 hypothetical protein [Nocardioides sp.]